MWINKKADGSSNSFNFVPPVIAGANQKKEVLFPFSEVQAPEYDAEIVAEITQMETFLQPEELTGNVALSLDIDEQVTPGAKIYAKFVADDQGDKTVTLGDGFDAAAPDVVVARDKTEFREYVYDGTAFVPTSNTAYLEAVIAALALRVTALET